MFNDNAEATACISSVTVTGSPEVIKACIHIDPDFTSVSILVKLTNSTEAF